MSGVRCQVSGVMCQVSGVWCIFFFFFSDKVVGLVGGGSVINGAYPAYFVDQSLASPVSFNNLRQRRGL